MAMNFLGTSITGSTHDVCYNGCPVNKVIYKDKNNVETVVYKTPDFSVQFCTCFVEGSLCSPAVICEPISGQWVCLGDGYGSACVNSATNPTSLNYRTDGHTTMEYPLNIKATNKGNENYYIRLYNAGSGSTYEGLRVSVASMNGGNVIVGYGNNVNCFLNPDEGNTITIPPGTTCTTIPITLHMADVSSPAEGLGGDIKLILSFSNSTRNMCIYSDSCSCYVDCAICFNCNYDLKVGDYV